ncbi:glycosyltransferase family 2 protein [Halomonas alkalisoli]|uniref:glycosyltransferase family 2 protein n=1 Tax=Halomonas alkalisoli TaxID=2907158 RepID=UPI001F36D2EB|nr:glycosyltransferase family 2 protein [Halomonas alkalisoli]MCE9681663.1 glycosyltransferase [Halomonas alkalisoli]
MTTPDYSTTRSLTREKPACFDSLTVGLPTWLKTPDSEHKIDEGGLRLQGLYKSSSEDYPLITIVTVVYNGVAFLEDTIKSIIEQTYENVEYVIVDGGSNDGSVDIIKKYEYAIDYWVSEKDNGISDAFNKAIKLSTGVYINFQGDGDGFCCRNSLKDVFFDLNTEQVMFVSARIQRITGNGEIIYNSKFISSFKKRYLLFKMSMPHQGLFTHREYFSKYGLFALDNKFCMDYEHLLRSYKYFPKVVTVNVVAAYWRSDGIGNGKTLEVLQEYDKIKRKNRVASPVLLYIIHYWSLFKFIVKKGLTLGK